MEKILLEVKMDDKQLKKKHDLEDEMYKLYIQLQKVELMLRRRLQYGNEEQG